VEDLVEKAPKAQLTTILAANPTICMYGRPSQRDHLARRIGQQDVVAAADDQLDTLGRFALSVLQCGPPGATTDELRALLPEGAEWAVVEPGFWQAANLGLVFPDGKAWWLVPAVEEVNAFPAGLGPRLRSVLDPLNADQVMAYRKMVLSAVEEVGLTDRVPSQASVASPGRANMASITKADRISHVVATLADPAIVRAVLTSAPTSVVSAARDLATSTPYVEWSYWPWERNYGWGRPDPGSPFHWLAEHGLLVPLDGRYQRSLGVLPREVGLALRSGRPYAVVPPPEPPIADPSLGRVDQDDADRRAATAARAVVHRIDDTVGAWADTPLEGNKNGGVGVRILRLMAKAAGTTVEEQALIVDLAWIAGLSDGVPVQQGRGRSATWSWQAHPSDHFGFWKARPIEVRWRQLALAWLTAERHPGLAGRKDVTDKTFSAMTPEEHLDAIGHRQQVLHALTDLDDGASASVDTLEAALRWRVPSLWAFPRFPFREAIEIIIGEAETLGVVVDGRLSTFGRLVFEGKRGPAESALVACLPDEVAGFTVQADNTIVAVGLLDREVEVELALLSDLESTGGASTYRVSEVSLRRAFDAGRTADELLAFLSEHAAKALPKALDFLVRDVERRHGHLRVGTATSFVVADDPAVLADAVAHKKTKKLGMVVVAPTVAVSSAAPDALLEGLRTAGFFPAAVGGEVRLAANLPVAPIRPGADRLAALEIRLGGLAARGRGAPNAPDDAPPAELPKRFVPYRGVGSPTGRGPLTVSAAKKLIDELFTG